MSAESLTNSLPGTTAALNSANRLLAIRLLRGLGPAGLG
jgi:hypothetical protein